MRGKQSKLNVHVTTHRFDVLIDELYCLGKGKQTVYSDEVIANEAIWWLLHLAKEAGMEEVEQFDYYLPGRGGPALSTNR